MARACLRIHHGETYKGLASYFANLVFDDDAIDIYGDECDVGEPNLPEVANMDALERYAGSNAR